MPEETLRFGFTIGDKEYAKCARVEDLYNPDFRAMIVRGFARSLDKAIEERRLAAEKGEAASSG